MSKEYRNAIRSRKLIRNAYCELIHEKKDVHVTVKEIVERADVSKSTFYAHYNDIEALLNEISDELLASLKSLVELYDGKKADPHREISSFIDYLKSHDEEYKKLFIVDYPSKFMSSFRALIKEIQNKYPNMSIVNSDDIEKKNAYISFFIMGLIELLMSYYKDSTTLSLDDIKNIAIDIYDRLCA